MAIMPSVAYDYNAALACTSAAIGLYAFHHSAIVVNIQDIAPTCTGSVYGLYLQLNLVDHLC